MSIYDLALMFGDMCFEMLRTFDGVVFRLEQHLDRLRAGLKVLRIDMPWDDADLMLAVAEVMEANTFAADDEHRILINVSRGLLPHYREVGPLGPQVMVADYPLRWAMHGIGDLYERGVDLETVSQRAIPARYLDPRIKSRSRQHLRMAYLEAEWPLLLGEHGHIAEGAGYNFFMVRDGRCYSPDKDCLRGISAHWVSSNQPIKWCEIDPYDVYIADEAFITATPWCILPVRSLDGLAVGDGQPGPVYREIVKQWVSEVGLDFTKQARAWDAARQP